MSPRPILGQVLINAGIGRMSALKTNGTRRDGGNDVNDPLQTWDVQCNQLCIAQQRARPLTDLRKIGILQSFPGWPEPNAV